MRTLNSIVVLSFILMLTWNSVARGSQQLGIADPDSGPDSWLIQSDSNILSRFSTYQGLGIGILRLDVNWADLETGNKIWQNPHATNYMQLAIGQGFYLKINAGALDGPPQWFFDSYPDARLQTNINGVATYSKNVISYWYPSLKTLLQEKDDKVFSILQNLGVLSKISYLVVPLGAAGEGIYPADWTLGDQKTGTEHFWFYDNHAQNDFRTKMASKYGTIANANGVWGTNFQTWDSVSIPELDTITGPFWNDVLTWYRDSKRSFIDWQIQHYQDLVAKYYSGSQSPPKLVILIPGTHYTAADWQDAVNTGSGDAAIREMTDSSYLLDEAHKYGAIAQPDGLPEMAELEYLNSYMMSAGYNVPMWGECAGGQSDVQEFANEVVANGLVGQEFVNSSTLFTSDSVTPVPSVYSNMQKAYSWLQGLWGGNPISSVTFQPGFTLKQNECVFADVNQNYRLCTQGDGNSVLSFSDSNQTKVLWSSYTASDCSSGSCYMTFQGDGNLVVYNGSALWDSETNQNATSPYVASQFVLSNQEPYLKLLDSNGDIIWSSSTKFSTLSLKAGQFVRFNNGANYLLMQGDGNLVIYLNDMLIPSNAVWASRTSLGTSCQTDKCSAVFQGDGNFVVDNGRDAPFSSHTSNPEVAPYVASRFNLADTEPFLSVIDDNGDILWSSTNRFHIYRLNPQQFIRFGSSGSYYYLLMQGDGNLVIYLNDTFIPSNAVWASGTSLGRNCTADQCYAIMQGDGNFVVYGQPTPWSSGTQGADNWLLLDGTGQNPLIEVVDSAGQVLWSPQ